MIEIARNLIQDDLKILIMDEPTSSLSQSEVQVLFKIMRELNAQGISIVYISHRLEEIMEIGDHVTILRDGNSGFQKLSHNLKKYLNLCSGKRGSRLIHDQNT